MLPILMQISGNSSLTISLASLIGAFATVLVSYLAYHKRFPGGLTERVEKLETKAERSDRVLADLTTRVAVISTNIEWLKDSQKELAHALGVKIPNDPKD